MAIFIAKSAICPCYHPCLDQFSMVAYHISCLLQCCHFWLSSRSQKFDTPYNLFPLPLHPKSNDSNLRWNPISVFLVSSVVLGVGLDHLGHIATEGFFFSLATADERCTYTAPTRYHMQTICQLLWGRVCTQHLWSVVTSPLHQKVLKVQENQKVLVGHPKVLKL